MVLRSSVAGLGESLVCQNPNSSLRNCQGSRGDLLSLMGKKDLLEVDLETSLAGKGRKKTRNLKRDPAVAEGPSRLDEKVKDHRT